MTITVNDADRKAAEELRAALAGVSGFWHVPGDDGLLCLALARHREQSELQLLEKMSLSSIRTGPDRASEGLAPNFEARIRQPRASAFDPLGFQRPRD